MDGAQGRDQADPVTTEDSSRWDEMEGKDLPGVPKQSVPLKRVDARRCDRMLDQLDKDLRLRTLPLAARMFWLQLVRLAASAPGFDGALHFGSDFGFLTSVSLSVSCTETEAETCLAALERRGLVTRGPDGASLILQDVERSSGRTEAARVNGLRGGRPRKGETREEARQRRQGHLMMPIAGGSEAAPETQRKPTGESSRAGTGTSSESISSRYQGTAREKPAWVSLGEKVAELCGMVPRAGLRAFEPVRDWLEAGVSPETILDLVRERMARAPRPTVSTLHYFTDAVHERRGEGGTGAGRHDAGKASAYAQYLRQWQADGCRGVPVSIRDFEPVAAA
jgi:hypothetical protein